MMTLTTETMRSRLLGANLPSPPQTLLKLMHLCQDDDAGLVEVAELLALDPALSAKILTVAHSAAYQSASADPLNLLQASNRLGTDLIKVLVIAEMVTQTFGQLNVAPNTDLRPFWKHSLSVALIAKELAPCFGYPASAQAYLAGLLHDIGRLALLVAAPQDAQAVFAQTDDDALALQEQHHLGMSHTEAAAWLLQRWHLSEDLVQSVLHHHDAALPAPDVSPLRRLLFAAHQIALTAPLSLPAVSTEPESTPAWPEFLPEVSSQQAAAVWQCAHEKVLQTARDLGLDISDSPRTSPTQSAPAAVVTGTDVHAEMAQVVYDRSVLNEMAMNLIGRSSNESALRHLQRYASALLQLEDSVVMLLRSNQQQLVPVSMSQRHQAAVQLSYEMSKDMAFARCVESRKVVFSGRSSRCVISLLNVLNADELVLIPLISARQCMGVLAAAVPPDLSQHVRGRMPLLQAFGTYAGLALARRRQTTMSAQTLDTISRNEQRQGLSKLLKELKALSDKSEPMRAIDLCGAIREAVHNVKDGRLVPGNIKIHCQLAEAATPVRSNVAIIKLITVALLGNAFERMNREGDIIISAGGMAYRNGAMFAAFTMSDACASSAQAIESEMHERPSITAGSDARPIGLANVVQLIESMAGHLSFKASAACTRFDILLPCAKHLQLVA